MEEAVKAKRPEADGYQSSTASSCILNVCKALGEACEAYGSDSITLLILGCCVTTGQADLNHTATDFQERMLAERRTVLVTLCSSVTV